MKSNIDLFPLLEVADRPKGRPAPPRGVLRSPCRWTKLFAAMALLLAPLVDAEECGGPRSAVSLDGVNDNVLVGGLGTQLPALTEVTVEFWQKVNTQKNQSTFSMSSYVNGSVFNAHVPYGDGNIYWDFGNISTGGRLVWLNPPSPVGSWHHFAFVASQSGGYMEIYRDGSLAQRENHMTPFASANLDLLIGGIPGLVSFGGQIDEFRIWRVARSETEIRADMNRALSVPQPGLWIYFRFDEGTGTLAADLASGFYGNLANGAGWAGSGALFRPCVTTWPAAKSGNPCLIELKGDISPNGSPTTAFFQWWSGTGSGFTPDQFNVSGVVSAIFAANPDTLYSYRLMGQNQGGSAAGNILTFYCASGPRTVTSAADNGPGTLREIIDSCVGGETILFDPNLPNVITLTNSELVIRNTLTIVGPGCANLSIVGDNSRVFRITDYSSAVISGLRLRGKVVGADGATGAYGVPTGATGGMGGQAFGGGILVETESELTLVECCLEGCLAQGGRGGEGGPGYYVGGDGGTGGEAGGGAIYSLGGVALHRCTFANNLAVGGEGGKGADYFSHGNGGKGGDALGGAICTGYSPGGTTLEMINCTASGNTAAGGRGGRGGAPGFSDFGGDGGNGGSAYGGAICLFNQCSVMDCIGLQASTISGNMARAGLGGEGGTNSPSNGASGRRGLNGDASGGGVVTPGVPVENTILAGNRCVDGITQRGPDVTWLVFSVGHNLIGKTEDSGGWVGNDLLGSAAMPIDPMLDPLADNGGPTPTMALQPCSPAVNAGAAMPGVITDQRGFARPFGGAADIGAYELQTSALVCYSLAVSAPCGGTVVRTPDAPRYPFNAAVLLTAVPAAGWAFSHWSGDANSFNNPLQVVLGSDTSITANFSPQASPCSCLTSGLISWWPAGFNVNDIIGVNHGTLQSGATYEPGRVGAAFSFDGVNDQVNFGPLVGNFGSSDFTIEFWVKSTSTANQDILSKRPTCGHSSFWHVGMNGAPYIEVDGDAFGAGFGGVTASIAVNDGAFHHVAFVRQGTSLKVYVDGALNNSNVAGAVANINNTSPMIAGWSPCQPVATTHYFNGSLDELTLYSRALAANEIQAIYDAGASGKCLEPFSITSINRSGSIVNLVWQSHPGLSYRVQYKQTLNDPAWLDLPGDVEAVGDTASKEDNTAGSATARYYRVMALR